MREKNHVCIPASPDWCIRQELRSYANRLSPTISEWDRKIGSNGYFVEKQPKIKESDILCRTSVQLSHLAK